MLYFRYVAVLRAQRYILGHSSTLALTSLGPCVRGRDRCLVCDAMSHWQPVQ